MCNSSASWGPGRRGRDPRVCPARAGGRRIWEETRLCSWNCSPGPPPRPTPPRVSCPPRPGPLSSGRVTYPRRQAVTVGRLPREDGAQPGSHEARLARGRRRRRGRRVSSRAPRARAPRPRGGRGPVRLAPRPGRRPAPACWVVDSSGPRAVSSSRRPRRPPVGARLLRSVSCSVCPCPLRWSPLCVRFSGGCRDAVVRAGEQTALVPQRR